MAQNETDGVRQEAPAHIEKIFIDCHNLSNNLRSVNGGLHPEVPMRRAALFYQSVYFALSIALLSCCMYPAISYADPPQYMYLEYDTFFERLSVTITHASAAPEKHYIKTVVIKKNGNILSANDYDSQPDSQIFTYIYQAPAEDGDVLEVTALCSTSGSKTDIFYVQKN
jgi:hypothetical protein